jgi:hypothetical protein
MRLRAGTRRWRERATLSSAAAQAHVAPVTGALERTTRGRENRSFSLDGSGGEATVVRRPPCMRLSCPVACSV